jgi:hypothetical protein
MYSDAQYCTSLNESFFANTQANYILLVHALNCKYKSLYMLCFYQQTIITDLTADKACCSLVSVHYFCLVYGTFVVRDQYH